MEKLIHLQAEILKKKATLKRYKRELHKVFVKEYKALFYFLDIIVFLTIIMNFSAVAMTNILLIEEKHNEGIDVVYYEANENVLAGLSDLKGVEEAGTELGLSEEDIQIEKRNRDNLLISFVFFAAYWGMMLFLYIFIRIRIHTNFQLVVLLICVCLYFSLLGLNFFNDFGMYIGKVLYG